MTRQENPVLVPGERLRLSPDGPIFRVVRVNDCAAYVKQTSAAGELVELPNGRAFIAHQQGDVLPISRRSFVYRVGQ